MPIAIVTGSGGLIGSESVSYFVEQGFDVIGLDNDMRAYFFGPEASTAASSAKLADELDSFHGLELDIRDREGVEALFAKHGTGIELVVHTAAQPSHDWAAREPHTDFTVNANGTLNLLQAARESCPEATFVFTSTNKVYGDRPNDLPLVELDTRWELPEDHRWYGGIDLEMSIDYCTHSLFGASKVAADVLVQEYGRYFDLRTACFRGGTLTGPNHAAAELHGFLAYVVRCAMTRTPYTVFGYRGKQVRDAIHSSDLIACFDAFRREPRVAEVYNIGGGRHSNVSVLEAIDLVQEVTGEEMTWSYRDEARIGDHIWWISDLRKFRAHYPRWRMRYGLGEILAEIHAAVTR